MEGEFLYMKAKLCNHPGLRKSLCGIASLFRFIPVLAWSISAIALGAGLALRHSGWTGARFSYLFLLVFIVSMFQGLASHAFNDFYDWKSGTDRYSKGILSGGTCVLKNGFFQAGHLQIIGWVSLIAGIAGGLYLVWVFGLFILVLLLVGIWSTVAYTAPPIRLCYHPLAGEWLGAWPAMIASTIGTFFILTGTVTNLAVAGALLHATFSVAWLMQHHLPDIEADLRAQPCKMTTVALVSKYWGTSRTKYVVTGYFGLVVILGLLFGFNLNPVFYGSVIFGLACIGLAVNTNPSDIRHITSRQVCMIFLSVGHAFSLAAVFALRLF